MDLSKYMSSVYPFILPNHDVTLGVKASEIPATTQNSGGGGRSKGVNLFLARQKMIADMMEQEEEEARAAEGEHHVTDSL